MNCVWAVTALWDVRCELWAVHCDCALCLGGDCAVGCTVRTVNVHCELGGVHCDCELCTVSGP